MPEDWAVLAESGDRVGVALVGLGEVAIHLAVDDVDRDSPDGVPDAIARLNFFEAIEVAHRLLRAATSLWDCSIEEAVRLAHEGRHGR